MSDTIAGIPPPYRGRIPRPRSRRWKSWPKPLPAASVAVNAVGYLAGRRYFPRRHQYRWTSGLRRWAIGLNASLVNRFADRARGVLYSGRRRCRSRLHRPRFRLVDRSAVAALHGGHSGAAFGPADPDVLHHSAWPLIWRQQAASAVSMAVFVAVHLVLRPRHASRFAVARSPVGGRWIASGFPRRGRECAARHCGHRRIDLDCRLF